MLYEYKGTVSVNGNLVQSSTGLRVEAENKREATYLLLKRLRGVYHTNANVQINLNPDLVQEVHNEKPEPKKEKKPLIDLEEVLRKKKAEKKKKEEPQPVEENSETEKEETNGGEN